MKNNLRSVIVFLDNGTNYSTNVSANVSDAEIVNYFVGQKFVRADEKTFDTCTKVKILN